MLYLTIVPGGNAVKPPFIHLQCMTGIAGIRNRLDLLTLHYYKLDMLDPPEEEQSSTFEVVSNFSKLETNKAETESPQPKKMDFLLELPNEDIGVKSSAVPFSHQVSMCSFLPNDSVSSLHLSDLQDMDLTGEQNPEQESAVREMVVNPGGMWTAHNKRASVTEQSSFSTHQELRRGKGSHEGRDEYATDYSNNSDQTYPFTKAARAAGERPVKKQRIVSRR